MNHGIIAIIVALGGMLVGFAIYKIYNAYCSPRKPEKNETEQETEQKWQEEGCDSILISIFNSADKKMVSIHWGNNWSEGIICFDTKDLKEIKKITTETYVSRHYGGLLSLKQRSRKRMSVAINNGVAIDRYNFDFETEDELLKAYNGLIRIKEVES